MIGSKFFPLPPGVDGKSARSFGNQWPWILTRILRDEDKKSTRGHLVGWGVDDLHSC